MMDKLLTVPSTDSNDARRRKLLNIMLMGVLPLTVLTLLATILAHIAGIYTLEVSLALYGGCFVALAGLALIFWINRRYSGVLAALLFLLLMDIMAAFVDEPKEVALGRSLLLLVVPIIMASVLLRPYASFLMAGLNSVIIAAFALSLGLVPNPYAMVVFFAIALVSWLSARALEQALAEAQRQARAAEQKSAELQHVTEELQQTVTRQAQLLDLVQELEVPVIPLQPGLILLPLIGRVDAGRAQKLNQTLLDSTYERHARVVIVDLTGLQLADEAMIPYLSEAAQGARLLGAEVIFSGISPEMAQTLTSLDIRLTGKVARDLQAALQIALTLE